MQAVDTQMVDTQIFDSVNICWRDTFFNIAGEKSNSKCVDHLRVSIICVCRSFACVDHLRVSTICLKIKMYSEMHALTTRSYRINGINFTASFVLTLQVLTISSYLTFRYV
uniref:Uncharacterized protein n=1 Tax=Strigamia maritima TaxID=126957 RepID=T1ISM7_STRMM